MPFLPGKLPERGRFKRLYEHINQIAGYVESLKPIESVGTITGTTSRGVIRQGSPQPTPAGGTGTNKTPVWQ